MVPERLLWIAAIIGTFGLSATPLSAWPHKHGQKLEVHFLAASTLLRGTWGYNQDIYLVDLVLAGSGNRVHARLVDEYPSYAAPISTTVLKSDSGTILRLARDSECDRPYGQMILRAAPGDLMAILPVKLSYQPKLISPLQSSEILPCYRTVRR
jgi:hypothetical protein